MDKNKFKALTERLVSGAATEEDKKALKAELGVDVDATIKAAAEAKAKAEKAEADEKLKAAAAAPKELSEEEYLAIAPPAIKQLVGDYKAEQAAKRTKLLKQLSGMRTAYTKEQLEKKDTADLEALADSLQPRDFSGAGLPRPDGAEAEAEHNPAPPKGYTLSLAAKRGEKPKETAAA